MTCFAPRSRLAAVLMSLAVWNGCSLFVEQEVQYLQSAAGRAGRDDVQSRLGRPFLVAATPSGEPIWVYQFRTAEKGGNGNWSITGNWCDEYVLTFDEKGILRSWTHKSKKHRDDSRPSVPCVNDGFDPER